ncbi:uncharacterized protein N7479_003009 [Penicillium vulpinum]|uniref:Uncharacterized protein n=1 Tax=Penicillium vulpinum TaxID=29845 RepID=A0A1V6RG65_9EURO|nr:uncharacterized protein N7479_003009 [Penicillium vulpinum]KAJ5973091.1 hypothetical protein N7479_003009 [Penicillium vulpinum]OQE00484.1 hypothetical protein PENVUL_c051G08170 [Penicillium vulpinum]
MRYAANCLWVISLLGSPSQAAHSLNTNTDTTPANANHIFNSIQSTLRHYESSIYPNGMSFFLATVQKGTRFYHGTGTPDPIVGVEWLAFKPQHSLGFAHRAHRRERGKRSFQDDQDYDQAPLVDVPVHPHATANTDKHTSESSPVNAGYLHTYAAAKDLRLLYIDGMSAGPGGSLESQDRILFNDTISNPPPGPRPPVGGPPAEQERAFQTCRMVKEVWGDRVDGIARTEGDFEIILCAFERDLEVVSITQTKPGAGGGWRGMKGMKGDMKGINGGRKGDMKGMKGGRKGGRKDGGVDSRGGPARGPRGPRGPGGPPQGGDCCSIDARYDQLLGQKIHLDFDHFVSAFEYGLDLFPGGSEIPLLDHIPSEQLEPVRRDINDMVNTLELAEHPFNWQAVADMIVFRYSDELKTLAAGNFSSVDALRGRIEGVLEPFIDYRHFGAREEIVGLCQNELIPASAPVESLGGRVVSSISRKVCDTLASGLLDEKDLDEIVANFKELVSFLGWTTWKNNDRAL